ncbi:LacI family transcriptional regulator [Vagococcus lutrae]|uniref:LacI family DNA-binding transcriptional regulator n=1 Tax=Vagococcus lutrae TaxID=81947 RepID=UPI00200F9B9C|nr:LacI family DNA-binding transcriptional regulator [Vagococcus lutrae]UQF23164.1 LacI family transcriptional regulator [Vagococcus lutrae]UQF64752.1 LacI family transcriptional regulator [Vagococcus lutrae]
MEKKTTLKDIAERASVSISTVSRVINGGASKVASPEVQEKIWQIVRETNYVPNSAAQALKRSTTPHETITKTIACVCSRSSNMQEDPFFSEISRAVEEELLKHGYLMKLSLSTFNTASSVLEASLASETVDGIILLGRIDAKQIKIIKNKFKHVVYTGLNKLPEPMDQVICNGYETSIIALDHLDKINEKTIYYLGETKNEVRYKAYQDWMAANRQISANLREYVIETPFSSQKAYEALKLHLETVGTPSALFCGNDLTALGAIKAIREQGLKIPEDISIISIDDIEMAQFSSPMLSTVKVPMHHLGKLSARLLVERIEQGNDLPVTIEVPPMLILRESCRIK